eukprot:jgi/Phyca11/528624/estExt2_fgenesh1_pm.C_PHYCAscaffold_320024
MAATKKTVLITGSTRGIGLALATQYTEAGWNVNTDKLVALAPFKIITIDTTDEASVAEAARQLDGIAIDVLINNAGTGFLTEIVEPSKELFVKVFEVNVVGPFLVSRALKSNLQLAAKAHVLGSITVGELASTFKGQYSYTTTKAALNMMTRSLAIDLRDSNVAVVAVHPGYVNTELTGNLGVLKPTDVAAAIVGVVDKVAIEDTGKFLNADPMYPNALPW